MRYADAETIVAKANEALSRGYRFIKLHEHRPDVLHAVRDALGPEVPIMVDCNCPWNAEEAVRMSREIDDLDLGLAGIHPMTGRDTHICGQPASSRSPAAKTSPP